MIFPEALGVALAARFRVPEIRTPATQRRGLVARMNALVKLHGGDYKRAAASAGVPERTWRDWRAGTHPPSPKSIRRLEGAYARQVIRPAVLRLMADPGKVVKEMRITAVVVADPKGSRYVNKTAHRTFRAEKINGQEVVRAWMSHGDDAAAQAAMAVIREQYGQTFAFEGNDVMVQLVP